MTPADVHPFVIPPPSVVRAAGAVLAWIGVLALGFLRNVTDPQLGPERLAIASGLLLLVALLGAITVFLARRLRRGAGWVRPLLTVLAAANVLGAVPFLVGSGAVPAWPGSTVHEWLGTAAAWAELLVSLALLWFLWQRETTAFVRSRPTTRSPLAGRT